MAGLRESKNTGVFSDGSRNFTLNRDPGHRVYGEVSVRVSRDLSVAEIEQIYRNAFRPRTCRV